MHELGERKKEEFYRSQQGRRLHVLFEEREAGGHFVGFSDNYVKVAVRTEADLSNRFAVVQFVGTMREDAKAPLLAVGEIVDVEAESAVRK
jgi:threonylcarbamoyladenosine tRNA methylthiotransferase MtaB